MKNNSVIKLRKFETRVINYPCEDHQICGPIEAALYPGVYKIEAYGASGGYYAGALSATTKRVNNGTICESQANVYKHGGNTVCCPSNTAGAGGYAAGFIDIRKLTKVFINIGGSGEYFKATVSSFPESALIEQRPKGGFNGGGYGTGYGGGSSGGGGSTDLRINENDVYHRVIVAGGGGGSDNSGHSAGSYDDGSGGCGGFPSGQGFWIGGIYNPNFIATQTSGFSFGSGESAMELGSKSPSGRQTGAAATDRAGGGGGWFGGYSSHHGNGGGGGGSSFILTNNSEIPSGSISSCDSFYESCKNGTYAFDLTSDFVFFNSEFSDGIWSGDGMMKITLFSEKDIYSCYQKPACPYCFNFILFVLTNTK